MTNAEVIAHLRVKAAALLAAADLLEGLEAPAKAVNYTIARGTICEEITALFRQRGAPLRIAEIVQQLGRSYQAVPAEAAGPETT